MNLLLKQVQYLRALLQRQRMKKSIKQTEKSTSSTTNKNARPFTAKKSGYKEEVFNNEEQDAYNKSDIAKDNKKNTSGPKS